MSKSMMINTAYQKKIRYRTKHNTFLRCQFIEKLEKAFGKKKVLETMCDLSLKVSADLPAQARGPNSID